jgi:hypothetical protein
MYLAHTAIPTHLLQVRVELGVNVLDCLSPRVLVVDRVAKARSINNSELQLDATLLNLLRHSLQEHNMFYYWQPMEPQEPPTSKIKA